MHVQVQVVRFYSLAILILTLFYPQVVVGESRGMRNNNPANLIKTSIKWEGKVKCRDTTFECFSTPYYGLRAMYRTLHTYYYKYNRKSIRSIIRRWSPPNENNTENIIRVVSKYLGVSPDSSISFSRVGNLIRLGTILVIIENGDNPYPQQLYRRAIEDAFGNNNNVRKYPTRGGDEVVVDEYEIKGTTTTSLDREGDIKEGSSEGSKGVQGKRVHIYEKNYSTNSNLRSSSIPTYNSSILWTRCDTWLDRVGEWFSILHRWKGCDGLEGGNWISNNPSPYPSGSRDLWAILRGFNRRTPITTSYNTLVV